MLVFSYLCTVFKKLRFYLDLFSNIINKNLSVYMKKSILPLVIIVVLSALSFAFIRPSHASLPVEKTETAIISMEDSSITSEKKSVSLSDQLMESMHLEEIGLSKNVLEYALKGYDKLVQQGELQNSDILTIVDFSQPSSKKRFYLIDIKEAKVLTNTYVSHGKNTGFVTAEKFSNIPESLQSSLGFYVTKGTYTGKHGLSLRLAGMERGFNDNAENRAIVVHGADYVGAHRLGSYMGRSFGCPALPRDISSKVINTIKNGSALFIYAPQQKYLQQSGYING